jgi:cell division protein FtsQ
LNTPDALSAPAPVALTYGTSLAVLRWLVALLLVAGSVAAGAWLLRMEPAALPVRVVNVDGAIHRLSAKVLAQAVTERLHSGLLTQDLCALRHAVEALPWVRSASLRRVWPDQIHLSVTEHEPIARWGDDGLVTADGIVFRPEAESLPPGLPQLSALALPGYAAPDAGRSKAMDDAKAPAVVANYLRWRERLATLGLKVGALAQDARGAWTLHLTNGLRLDLGAERVEDRLGRFTRTYPQLAEAGRAEVIDLRYANGLAVRWAAGAAPGDAAMAQTEPADTAASEARPIRAKAIPAVESHKQARNKG